MTAPVLLPPPGLYRIGDLRGYLQGEWEISRRFEDHRDGTDGEFCGRARCAPTREGLHYGERGEIRLGSHRGTATREYLLFFPEPCRAMICFPDRRLFHELNLSVGACPVGYECGADSYRGTYRAVGPDRWDVRWRIRGPWKDQTLVSVFRRRGPPAAAGEMEDMPAPGGIPGFRKEASKGDGKSGVEVL